MENVKNDLSGKKGNIGNMGRPRRPRIKPYYTPPMGKLPNLPNLQLILIKKEKEKLIRGEFGFHMIAMSLIHSQFSWSSCNSRTLITLT